jgi:translation elongation factor EF-G
MSRHGAVPPLLLLPVQPKSDADRDRLDEGLRQLMDQDASLSVELDHPTGDVVIGAAGELQLEILIDRLKREFEVEAWVGRPRVAYLEALTEPTDGDGAIRVVLEPVMEVEVVAPREHAADVGANLLTRGARIESSEARDDNHVIRALVPLSQMFGYEADLRSRTCGRATHSLHFARYEPVRDDPDETDGARDSLVGAPLRPVPRPRAGAISLPEPEDDEDERFT